MQLSEISLSILKETNEDEQDCQTLILKLHKILMAKVQTSIAYQVYYSLEMPHPSYHNLLLLS